MKEQYPPRHYGDGVRWHSTNGLHEGTVKYSYPVDPAGAVTLKKYKRGSQNRRRQDKKPVQKRRNPRTAMLNLQKLGDFKYYARNILSKSDMDETETPTFMANIIAKASRVSIKEAKDYVREVEKRGICSKEVSEEVCDLLDRFTKYR